MALTSSPAVLRGAQLVLPSWCATFCMAHPVTVSWLLHICSIQGSSPRGRVGTQASTDTEPRRDRRQQARPARPRTSVGQQDEKFNFGNFIKGDLPGKLGMLLVSLTCNTLLAERIATPSVDLL